MLQIVSKANLLAYLSPASNFSPSHLQRPPPHSFYPKTFKVRQTGPFVSSPWRLQDSERQEAPSILLVRDFPKVLDGYMQFLTRGKAYAVGESWGGLGRGEKVAGHRARISAAA